MKARQDAHGARTRTSIHERAKGVGTETRDEIKAARDEAEESCGGRANARETGMVFSTVHGVLERRLPDVQSPAG